MKRDTLPPLTDHQLRALQVFADRHGRRWKEQLRQAWMNAAPIGPTLHQLRNTHGPSWLDRFRLPA